MKTQTWNWDGFIHAIEVIGQRACTHQRSLIGDSISTKSDGSLVTTADVECQAMLMDAVEHFLPDVTPVGEETYSGTLTTHGPIALIDPIDGTDSFSQGLPFWAISVGIIGEDGCPAAGAVYAPRLGIFAYAVQNEAFTRSNGVSTRLSNRPGKQVFGRLSGMAVSSNVHRQLDLSAFPGKLRSFGTAAAHLTLPSLHERVVGALQDDGARAWDVAGAHAVAAAQGLCLRYFDGSDVDYRTLEAGARLRDFVLLAPVSSWSEVRNMITRR